MLRQRNDRRMGMVSLCIIYTSACNKSRIILPWPRGPPLPTFSSTPTAPALTPLNCTGPRMVANCGDLNPSECPKAQISRGSCADFDFSSTTLLKTSSSTKTSPPSTFAGFHSDLAAVSMLYRLSPRPTHLDCPDGPDTYSTSGKAKSRGHIKDHYLALNMWGHKKVRLYCSTNCSLSLHWLQIWTA